MTDINTSESTILEALNNKVDLASGGSQATTDYVVSWKNPTTSDPTWYRVYKSGWVEQGGYIATTSTDMVDTQVTLLKSFKDTSYHILIGNYATTSVSDSTVLPKFGCVKSYTTTTINIMVRSNTYQNGCFWQAAGVGA